MKARLTLVIPPVAVSALLSPVDSPCAVNCGNVLASVASDEIQCSESAFGSGAGAVFKSCVDCQVDSTYYSDELTDVGAGLYNLRYASAFCLFGLPDGEALTTPCVTSTACGPLLDSLDFDKLATNASSYDYCSLWQSDVVSMCTSCLSASSQNFLRNYIRTLDAGCQQLPVNGTPISIEGSIFSTQVVNATAESPVSTFTAESFVHNGISLSAKVGIAFAALVVLFAITGTGIICRGRRRRRAFLRTLEKKPSVAWAGPGFPFSPSQPQRRNSNTQTSPQSGNVERTPGWAASIAAGLQRYAGDVNETPLSQKPLRGWDDSPISAMGEKNFSSPGRHFSPYSSQFGSPVSGTQEIPSMEPPREIGLQLRDEEFEMQVVGERVQQSQPGCSAPQHSAPVLMQPDFGRLSSEGGPRRYSPEESDRRRAS
ncbi:hypothetical protein BROUX41_002095 [Berkeleyomyces rouxiae]|uniref:uncharacterized protein n=1 Tax=Berkeleyomyces rouxiae TaxID=2035830 RepID=UPI003B7FBEF4